MQIGASGSSAVVIRVSTTNAWQVEQELATSGDTNVTGADHAVMAHDDTTVGDWGCKKEKAVVSR